MADITNRSNAAWSTSWKYKLADKQSRFYCLCLPCSCPGAKKLPHPGLSWPRGTCVAAVPPWLLPLAAFPHEVLYSASRCDPFSNEQKANAVCKAAGYGVLPRLQGAPAVSLLLLGLVAIDRGSRVSSYYMMTDTQSLCSLAAGRYMHFSCPAQPRSEPAVQPSTTCECSPALLNSHLNGLCVFIKLPNRSSQQM